MKRGNIRRYSGFSLIEVVASLALIVIIVTVAYNFYILAKEVWLITYVQGDLQEKGQIVLEKIIRGVDENNYGIQEAVSFTIPQSDTINYTGSDGTTRIFYQDVDKIIHNNGTILIELISEDVFALTFDSPQSDLVTINLVLQRNVGALDRDISVNLNASVKLRNL